MSKSDITQPDFCQVLWDGELSLPAEIHRVTKKCSFASL